MGRVDRKSMAPNLGHDFPQPSISEHSRRGMTCGIGIIGHQNCNASCIRPVFTTFLTSPRVENQSVLIPGSAQHSLKHEPEVLLSTVGFKQDQNLASLTQVANLQCLGPGKLFVGVTECPCIPCPNSQLAINEGEGSVRKTSSISEPSSWSSPRRVFELPPGPN